MLQRSQYSPAASCQLRRQPAYKGEVMPAEMLADGLTSCAVLSGALVRPTATFYSAVSHGKRDNAAPVSALPFR